MLQKLFLSKSDSLNIEFFRYTIVGGVAFAVDFSTLYACTEWFKIHYLIAAGIAFIVGLTVNYGLSTLWVFSASKLDNRALEFLIFGAIGLVGLGLNEAIIWFCTEKIRLYYLISKLVSTVLVYCWNFFARKYLLYK